MSYARRNNYFASDKWREYRDEVKRRAYGNWDQILLSLAPEGLTAAVSAGGRHVPCPRHGGTDGFRMFNDFRLTGGSVCNTCGTHADGFASLQWLYGWTFSEAVRAVGDVVGVQHYRDDDSNSPRPAAKIDLVEPPKRKSPEQVAREDEAKARRMAEAWNGSYALTDPEAEIARAYLRNRGITSSVGPLEDLRFHPGMAYFENKVNLGEFPTLLCLMRQPDGAPTTIQRIFLTPDGQKADVDHPKKIMPYRSTVRYAGSAVRLDHQLGPVLCATEGVETGLAWRAMTGLPTWSTCVAGLLEELVIPESVKILIACGDHDLPTKGHEYGRGWTAATKLVERVRGSGRKAAIYLPNFELDGFGNKMDWLDVLNLYGLEYARHQPFALQVRDVVAAMLGDMGLSWEQSYAHF